MGNARVLKPAQVLAIRRNPKKTLRELAFHYRTTEAVIFRVRHNLSYKEIQP